MRILIQRVKSASVAVDGVTIAEIESGLLLLVGFSKNDSSRYLSKMVDKVYNLRLFTNQQGRFDSSLLEIGGGLLVVPQFTLYADCKKGRRPDFSNAMHPELAAELFDQLIETFKLQSSKVKTGVFGANMQVTLQNDGPVTILLDSDN